MKKYNLKKMRKAMKKTQDESRYEHTLGVAYTAGALAMRYRESVDDALVAGMLHDCAKCLTDEKRLSICEKHGIPMSEIEKNNPFLLHGKVGAYLAQKKYGVKDENILNAIAYHTTGREKMSALEKIVFVADYIEPSRTKAPRLQEMRELAFVDLDEAMIQILKDTLQFIQDKGGEISPETELTLRYYEGFKEDRTGNEV